jgi:hypothetical protein
MKNRGKEGKKTIHLPLLLTTPPPPTFLIAATRIALSRHRPQHCYSQRTKGEEQKNRGKEKR